MPPEDAILVVQPNSAAELRFQFLLRSGSADMSSINVKLGEEGCTDHDHSVMPLPLLPSISLPFVICSHSIHDAIREVQLGATAPHAC